MADLSTLSFPDTTGLWDFLLNENPLPEKADAIIVLGGSSINIPRRAVSLIAK
jgi:hypothetical protein